MNDEIKPEGTRSLLTEKHDNIMRLTHELYAAMKDMVDFRGGSVTAAYIYGDATKDDQFRACIVSTDIRPSRTT